MPVEHACIVTTVPKHGFPAQSRGAIVHVDGQGQEYEVELFDTNGATLAVKTYGANEVAQRNPDFDYAISLNLHTVGASEYAVLWRSLIEASPAVKFSDMQAGSNYVLTDFRSVQIFSVTKTTPKGGQAEIQYTRNPDDTTTHRIYAGSTSGVIRLVTTEFVTLSRQSHEAIVTEAVARGLMIPSYVRREQPQLFIQIPERFTKERVVNSITGWKNRAIGYDDVERWIEGHHESIRKIHEDLPKLLDLNPRVGEDMKRIADGHLSDIDFYRWLQPHVAEGGPLYVPAAAKTV